MIAQKRNLKRETRFTLLRRDYTGNPRLEKKMPLTRRFLFCARGIITTAWLSYLRIERVSAEPQKPAAHLPEAHGRCAAMV